MRLRAIFLICLVVILSTDAYAKCGKNTAASLLNCLKFMSGTYLNVKPEDAANIEWLASRANIDILLDKGLPGHFEVMQHHNKDGTYSVEAGLFYNEHPGIPAAISELQQRMASAGYPVELTSDNATVWLMPEIMLYREGDPLIHDLFTYYGCGGGSVYAECYRPFDSMDSKAIYYRRLANLMDVLVSSADADTWIKALNLNATKRNGDVL